MEYDSDIIDSSYDALCREYGRKNVIRRDDMMYVITGESLVEVGPLARGALVAMACIKRSEGDIYQFPVDEIAYYTDIITKIPILIPSVYKSPDGEYYVPHYTNPVAYRGRQDDKELCSTVDELGMRASFASMCLKNLLNDDESLEDVDKSVSRTCLDAER